MELVFVINNFNSNFYEALRNMGFIGDNILDKMTIRLIYSQAYGKAVKTGHFCDLNTEMSCFTFMIYSMEAKVGDSKRPVSIERGKSARPYFQTFYSTKTKPK